MKIRNVLLATTIVSAPGIAAAQMPLPSFEPAPPLYGPYLGRGGGFNWLQNEQLINGLGTAADASLQSKFGYAAIGTLGWAFTNGLRLNSKVISATISSRPAVTSASRLALVAGN